MQHGRRGEVKQATRKRAAAIYTGRPARPREEGDIRAKTRRIFFRLALSHRGPAPVRQLFVQMGKLRLRG